MKLTTEEKQAINTLNFVAEFDGIIEREEDVLYILQKGIDMFISPKRKHLLTIDTEKYPLKIKY